MDHGISDRVVELLRSRRALLWVCQRYDLLPTEEPHDYRVPDTEAALRYRSDPDAVDMQLASFFWEGMWLEGAASPILAAVRCVANGATKSNERPIVVLASADDVRAEVTSREFLPICVLPGVLDHDAPLGNRYDHHRARARSRISWDFATRLTAYQGRVLIVIGAETQADLELLYEVLEDNPIIDLQVLVQWPIDTEPPHPPTNPGISFSVFSGSTESLLSRLSEAGAPSSTDLPRWRLRVADRSLELRARDIERVLRRFYVLTEQDLLVPETLRISDLMDFLGGKLDNWNSYAIGLPAAREYRTSENRTLSKEIGNILHLLAQDDDAHRTFVLEVPAEGGAGTTTLLRTCAFETAKAGYPVLILRPDQADLNLEDLMAFTTALAEAALSQRLGSLPPMLVVLDVEHASIPHAKQVSQNLAVIGRRALVLKAIPFEGEQTAEIRRRSSARLTPLLARASATEVSACATTFNNAIVAYSLPIDTKSLEDWRSYEAAMKWQSPSGDGRATSLFWVAIRFFLTEGMDFSHRDQAQDALGQWIERRFTNVTDKRMMRVLNYVAVLSSMRLVSPFTTVFRPVTGGTFGSDMLKSLQELRDVIEWVGISPDLQDQVLRFGHPVLAEEFVRRRGIRTMADKTRAIADMLANLSPGHPADQWLVETLASTIWVPGYEERHEVDWNWRLEAFDNLPPAVRDQSKTILHHWARCLYLSADRVNSPSLSDSERCVRVEAAIDKLRKATTIARRPARDEHPSHLYNTLGTAYFRYASLLELLNEAPDKIDAAWENASQSFRESIRLSGGMNIEALLAFARRLLGRARTGGAEVSSVTLKETEDVVQALGLLDQAEEAIQVFPGPDPSWDYDLEQHRSQAMAWLGSDLARKYVTSLQTGERPEIGFYCEAKMTLRDLGDDKGVPQALQIMDQAEQRGVQLRWRSLLFVLSLMRRHATEKYSFEKQLGLYVRLESDPDYEFRPIDQFRTAVLCYQTNRYAEGQERFRKLRERIRQTGEAVLHVRDVWRDPSNPEQPRLTAIRVTKLITEWRAYGEVTDFHQTIPLRPRHFEPPPELHHVESCVVRFERNGPLAVPPRFEGL